MNERPPTSPTSRSRSTPLAMTAHGRRDLGRDAGLRAESLPRPPGRTPSTAPGYVAQDAGDAADEAVAAERDRQPSRPAAPRASSRACLEVARDLGADADAEVAQRVLGTRQDPRGAAAARGRVEEQGDVAGHAAYPKTSVSSRSAIATGSGRAPPRGLAVGRTGQHDRAVDARRVRGAEIGVDSVADHERPSRAEPVQRRLDERRLGLAHARRCAPMPSRRRR